MTDGRRLGTRALIPLSIGIIALYNVVRQPRFQAIQTVDVVLLVASGMCFGVTLLSIIASFRGSRNS